MNRSLKSKAYTLMELAISMGMMGLVGGVIYTVLNGGMIMFSKNISTNYSNLAVRTSSMRLVQDLHESVGRAELVTLTSGTFSVATTTAAQGVRFPILLNQTATNIISNSAGSKNITTSSSGASISLRIPQQPIAPKVGDILVFPDINDALGNTLTRTITAVTTGNPTTVTVNDLGVSLTISSSTPPDPTMVYVIRQAAYCVVTTATENNVTNGIPSRTEVRYYADASDTSSYTVVNNDLTTYLPPLASGDYVSPYGSGSVAIPAGPFAIYSSGPNDPGNAVQVQLISINTDTGKRSYVGDRFLLSQIIPPKTLIVQSTNYN